MRQFHIFFMKWLKTGKKRNQQTIWCQSWLNWIRFWSCLIFFKLYCKMPSRWFQLKVFVHKSTKHKFCSWNKNYSYSKHHIYLIYEFVKLFKLTNICHQIWYSQNAPLFGFCSDWLHSPTLELLMIQDNQSTSYFEGKNSSKSGRAHIICKNNEFISTHNFFSDRLIFMICFFTFLNDRRQFHKNGLINLNESALFWYNSWE